MPVHERVRTVGELISALKNYDLDQRVWIKETEPETGYHAADVSTERVGHEAAAVVLR